MAEVVVLAHYTDEKPEAQRGSVIIEYTEVISKLIKWESLDSNFGLYKFLVFFPLYLGIL